MRTTSLSALALLLAFSAPALAGDNTKVKKTGQYVNAVSVADGAEHGATQYFDADGTGLQAGVDGSIRVYFLTITTADATGDFTVIVTTPSAPAGGAETFNIPGGYTVSLEGIPIDGVQVSVIPTGGNVYLVGER